MWTGKSEVSIRLMAETQERPVRKACQKVSRCLPKGVTIPMPVTTTLRSDLDLRSDGTILLWLPSGTGRESMVAMRAEYGGPT
jgi:hypothetical protein